VGRCSPRRSSCAHGYTYRKTVTLKAKAAKGSVLAGWIGRRSEGRDQEGALLCGHGYDDRVLQQKG